jgi:hypothetical protein
VQLCVLRHALLCVSLRAAVVRSQKVEKQVRTKQKFAQNVLTAGELLKSPQSACSLWVLLFPVSLLSLTLCTVLNQ